MPRGDGDLGNGTTSRLGRHPGLPGGAHPGGGCRGDRRVAPGAPDTRGAGLSRDRGRPRARLRAGRLGRGDPSARGTPRVGAPCVAQPELRPARRDARGHRRLGRRVGRHDGRGRPARPRADRSAHRHRDARTGRRRLRPGHERAAARTGAQRRVPRGQVARHAARQGSTGIRLRELPPPSRRGRPVGRRLRRPRDLPRRGDLVGGAADHDLPHAHARGGRPARPDTTCADWPRTSGGSCSPAAPGLCGGSAHWAPLRCCWRHSWPWCSSPVERPGGGRCQAGPRR